MSTALTVSRSSPVPAIPIAEAERTRSYANAEKAAATRRAYGTDFAIFRAWCAERQLEALPGSAGNGPTAIERETVRFAELHGRLAV